MATTTTLPKLTWAQFIEDVWAPAFLNAPNGKKPQGWTTDQFASNAEALDTAGLIHFNGFDDTDPDLYADLEIRLNVIELLTEIGGEANAEAVRQLQAIN